MTPTIAQISSNRDGSRLVTKAIVRMYTDVPACRRQTALLQKGHQRQFAVTGLRLSSDCSWAMHSPVERCSSSQTSDWLQAEHQ